MEQPFDGIDEVYDLNLRVVLDFFKSKLRPYYSSSRLTWLLTLLDIPPDLLSPGGIPPNTVPLPPRLRMVDSDGLSFFPVSYFSLDRNVFRDFLDSGHPLALNGQRHAIAASACLKIIFVYDPAPHSCTLRVNRSRRHRTDRKAKKWQHRSPGFLWHLRTNISSHVFKLEKIPQAFLGLRQKVQDQQFRSGHLKFLLERSAYSDNLLNFARHRVFRFGYLQRNHPTYMKEAIFALPKYIQRVTGETAQVRTCESIWGRQRWFTAN